MKGGSLTTPLEALLPPHLLDPKTTHPLPPVWCLPRLSLTRVSAPPLRPNIMLHVTTTMTQSFRHTIGIRQCTWAVILTARVVPRDVLQFSPAVRIRFREGLTFRVSPWKKERSVQAAFLLCILNPYLPQLTVLVTRD